MGLIPEQVAIARDMHDRLRAAEARNLFGRRGGGGLTDALRSVELTLQRGRLVTDSEQPRLIDLDPFMAELAGMIMRYPGVPAHELARHVIGALTYAFVFDPADYAVGTWLVHDALRAQGFRLEARRNGWASPEHRYVATSWHDTSQDVPFQLQFHTAASFAARKLGRASSGVIADPLTPRAEAARLRAELAEAWAAVAPPPGIAQIGDYRRGGR